MHARSRGHTKDEGTSRAHQSSMHRTVASVAKSATPAPANRIHGDRPARDEIANGSRRGAAGRERFANGGVGTRTGAVGRERFANGASGRKLFLEVHVSAALFTAGDLSLLK